MDEASNQVAAGSPERAGPAPAPPPSAEDLAALEALRRGDEGAFTTLVGQHHETLRRIARLYVSSPAVADEVVQDTWLAVIRGLWAFEGRSALRTWIFRILINRARTRARREGRTVPLFDVGEGEVDPPGSGTDSSIWGTAPDPERDPDAHGRSAVPADRVPTPDSGRPPRDSAESPEARLLSEETGSRIRRAIETLPPTQRLVITMRDLEGCSSEEVCNALDLTETNQRVILHRARSRVRAMLEPYFGGK